MLTDWARRRLRASVSEWNPSHITDIAFTSGIQHAVWPYFRFTLSYRDIEDLFDERGIDVSYETIRRWAAKFGRQYAKRLRQRRPKPSSTWHIDEVFAKIGSEQCYLWRAAAA